jgi:hypothetical protein
MSYYSRYWRGPQEGHSCGAPMCLLLTLYAVVTTVVLQQSTNVHRFWC